MKKLWESYKSWDRPKKLTYLAAMLFIFSLLFTALGCVAGGYILDGYEFEIILNIGFGHWSTIGDRASTTSLIIFIAATIEMIMYCFAFYKIAKSNRFSYIFALVVALLITFYLCVTFSSIVCIREGYIATENRWGAIGMLIVAGLTGFASVALYIIATYFLKPIEKAKESL